MSNNKNNRKLFDPRFGRRPFRFVGRDDVLRDLSAAVGDPEDSDRIMIVTGIKGSGKSSVLAEIRAGLDPERVAFVNLTADDEMIGSFEKAKQDKPSVLSAVGDMTAQRNDEIGVVYFMDDVIAKRHGLREFLAYYFQRVRQGENVMLLLAGAPNETDELLKDGALAFLRRAGHIVLDNVRTEEVFALYEEAFAGRETEKSALLRAAEATAGYPYLIQLIGYYLSKEEQTIDSKAADKAIFLAKIELYKNIHAPMFWGGSSKDRVFLWAMAQDDGPSEFGNIAKRMNVSTGYASKYRERLIGAGAIYRSAYGELAFTLPFMKEYIEKEYIENLGGEGGKRRL